MARVLKGTHRNSCSVGIHLWKPSPKRIEDALDDAKRQGFSFVYVHKAKPRFCSADIPSYESGPAGAKISPLTPRVKARVEKRILALQEERDYEDEINLLRELGDK